MLKALIRFRIYVDLHGSAGWTLYIGHVVAKVITMTLHGMRAAVVILS
jgi:hypothetical protein